ncbi:dockerin type I domain-containing protein [Ruminococcus sp. XPD3002]|uniref:dockerin type I domain-containing protein n=1 Tax=Ruminococcus sp. XPD3002 TaxID=1452269 RepID=UPI00091ABDFE|nr:NPCBM/NEW2 domain-containing protein [Ruminococcus flavefaciens]
MRSNKAAAILMSGAMLLSSGAVYMPMFGGSAIIASAADRTSDDMLSAAETSTASSGRVKLYYKGDRTQSFKMSGRTYYNGVDMSMPYSSSTCTVSLDVSAAKTISWTTGHVDGGSTSSGTLEIYLDDALYDSVPLKWNMTPEDYKDLDVSGASTLKLVAKATGGCEYALGDIIVDGAAPALSHDVPEYTDTAAFIKGRFYAKEQQDFPSGDKSESFSMAGRSYYQGIVLKGSFSSTVSNEAFNVENVSKVSFDLGQIDNNGQNEATLNVYVDEEFIDKYPVSHSGIQQISLDIPEDAKTLRFEAVREGKVDIGLGDLHVDSLAAGEQHSVPEYEKSGGFIDSGYDSYKVTKYTGNSKANNFNVNGRTYYQGIVFNANYSSDAGRIIFNTENVNELLFSIGCIDNTGTGSGSILVYYDNVLKEQIAVSRNMPIIEGYLLNVSDASEVRLDYQPASPSVQAALMDISVDGNPTALDHIVPTYDKTSSFLDSGFNSNKVTVKNGNGKAGAYEMNGRVYYDGIVFNGSYSSDVSYITYNVENIKELSWDLGHVDGSGLKKGTLTVYLDDAETETYELDPQMPVSEGSIDVSSAKTARFVLNREGGGDYALANFKADGKAPAYKYVTPEYADTQEFLKDAFTPSSKVKVYNGASPKVEKFTMGGTEFTQGIIFSSAYSSDGGYISFNTENIDNIYFNAGHIDSNEKGKNAELYIYKDGVQDDKITLTPDMGNIQYVFSTKDAQFVQFYYKPTGNGEYAIADITLTAAEKAAPEYTLGDVNEDGMINSSDATAILVAYSAMSTGEPSGLTDAQIIAADVDFNDKIDASDATGVLQYYSYLSTGGKDSPDKFFKK